MPAPIEQIHLLVDFGMCVVLWLVQLVIYPSFLHLKETDLVEWHQRYTLRVSFVIMPLMLAQLGLSAYAAVVHFDPLTVCVLLLVVISWLLTFFVSVPLHNKIASGVLDTAVRRKLIQTNWPRVFVWSLVFVLGLF